MGRLHETSEGLLLAQYKKEKLLQYALSDNEMVFTDAKENTR